MAKFNQMASHWCKKCGASESIIGHRQMLIQEELELTADGDISTIHESAPPREVTIVYICESCGAEADEPSELMTISPFEALNTFNAVHRAEEEEDDEDSY